ncbi:competence protein ComK [Sporosarcina sp. CAU 1771]
MGFSKNFILAYDAVMLLPRYDENGSLYTLMVKSNKQLQVEYGPTQLIDLNLRFHGSSLRGASDGSRMVLGRGNMYPVIINKELSVCWFPSKSPHKEGCCWFALHQVKEYIGISRKRTRVVFHNQSTFIVDMSRASFENKVKRAYKLLGKLVYRMNGRLEGIFESEELYNLNYIQRKHKFGKDLDEQE